jgi:hypothetical protein
MKPSQANFLRVLAVVCLLLPAFCAAGAQKAKDKAGVTGRYEGTAKNKAQEIIEVTLDLTETDGVVSGTINSSHGNFPISSGSRQGKTVTLQFDAQGTSGTISMETSEDRLTGSWTAGDDEGPIDVKKVSAQEGGTKGKS